MLKRRAAYKVVAFMVTVRLVENRAKRNVGMVMVVIFMTMYNRLETVCRSWRIQMMSLAKSPSQEEEPWASTRPFARVTAELKAPGVADDIVFESAELKVVVVFDRSMVKAT